MRLHRLVAFTALGTALLVGRPAAAGTTSFSAGSLIIPMDLCYQPTLGTGGWSSGRSGYSLPNSLPSTYCPDPVATPADDVLKAYGLVYTLLQNSINVHYIIEPTKSTLGGVDLTVSNGAGNPVYLVNNATAASSTLSQQRSSFMKTGNTQVQFRGAPFVIDVADASAALTVIQNDATSSNPQFNNVQIYWAMTNFNAPEKGVLVGPPPLIALNGLMDQNVQILEDYLSDAGLTSQTTTCTRRGSCTTTNTINFWPSIGAAFTVIGDDASGNDGRYTQFTTGDALNAGGFKVLWSPHWEGLTSVQNGTDGCTGSGRSRTCLTTAQAQTQLDNVMAKMQTFAKAGNSSFAECIGMGTIEGQASEDSAPNQTASTYGHFLTNSTGSTAGFDANAISTGWPLASGGHAGETFTSDSYVDPIVQIGDYVFSSVDGYTTDMRPASGVAYQSNTTRLLYTVAPAADPAKYNGRDILVHGYMNGNTAQGQVVYLAGHSYAKSSLTAGERIPLNTLLFLGQVISTTELTRSAPIVYTPNGNTYLGTYLQSTAAASGYPPWQGHFREYPGSSLSGANVSKFNTLTANWDAATHITAQITAGTRNLFTAVNISGTMTQKPFTTANAATLGTTSAIITAVTAGGLGGIDHSIPAIIGPSTIAGSSTRPVVAYVGALDGMLHAFLISGSLTYNGHSYVAGDEVWAFIPPSQLTNMIAYSGGVDGSASVGDAFVDTGDGSGKKWHTLLAIPDGHFTGGTFDVLDITDPSNPKFVWEASDSVTTGGKTFVLGRAQGLAISPVTIGGNVKYAYFVATDNVNSTGGNASGGNAFNLFALEAGKGTVLWRYNHAYVNNTTDNDVPGTIAVIDDKGDNGPVTKVFFGDLEGKVWSLNAPDGSSPTTIYDAAVAQGHAGSLNYPIESGVVLYRDPSNSHLDVLGVTGGADWVPTSVSSYVFKVDTTTNTGTTLYTTAAGERVYAVPTIYGNSAYLITAQGNLGQQSGTGTDFSQTGGNLIRINLGSAGGSTVLANVKAGASEVAVDSNGNVVAASAAGLTMNANAGRDTSQAVIALQNAAAKALTVRAWLDLH